MMTTETNDNSRGTGYCTGNDFTIKPLTTTVDIKLIRRLMATWAYEWTYGFQYPQDPAALLRGTGVDGSEQSVSMREFL